jgi:hypothetical protein
MTSLLQLVRACWRLYRSDSRRETWAALGVAAVLSVVVFVRYQQDQKRGGVHVRA